MKAFFIACILTLFSTIVVAQDLATVTLRWDPNPETDLAGYKVYDCLPAPADCDKADNHGVIDVGNVVMKTLAGTFQEGSRFFVTAYDTTGNESGSSNKATLGIPPTDPTGLTINVTIIIQP